jgi:phosphatidylglycerophosphate synthase
MSTTRPRPLIVPVGANPTPIWGMTNAERIRRIAAARGPSSGEGRLLANLRYAFDPNWVVFLTDEPGTVVTRQGVPVLAHAMDPEDAAAVERAMLDGTPLPPRASLRVREAEDEAGILNHMLRKRERPFAESLVPETVQAIERLSYFGAYKGVTDLLTKYLWPEWAFVLTRIAARWGVTPNQVTAVGSVLCAAAAVLFWHGWLWTGMIVGLGFMVLDTVDGKLARCTITSSAIGNVWDHGVDLVHPPFWWWAWCVGCAARGHPLDDRVFWWVMGAILIGYVAERLIEGGFARAFGFHIHVWRRFDSWFRLITARRNPNMVILFAFMLIARPDWGIAAVAVWTLLSLVVHLIRLMQALAVRGRGDPIVSWLA